MNQRYLVALTLCDLPNLHVNLMAVRGEKER